MVIIENINGFSLRQAWLFTLKGKTKLFSRPENQNGKFYDRLLNKIFYEGLFGILIIFIV